MNTGKVPVVHGNLRISCDDFVILKGERTQVVDRGLTCSLSHAGMGAFTLQSVVGRLSRHFAMERQAHFVFIYFYCLFYFERHRESMNKGVVERKRGGERERERERERIPSRLHIVSSEPDMGLDLTNREIMTWGDNQSRMLNRLSHPDVPQPTLYLDTIHNLSKLGWLQFKWSLCEQNCIYLFVSGWPDSEWFPSKTRKRGMFRPEGSGVCLLTDFLGLSSSSFSRIYFDSVLGEQYPSPPCFVSVFTSILCYVLFNHWKECVVINSLGQPYDLVSTLFVPHSSFLFNFPLHPSWFCRKFVCTWNLGSYSPIL